MRTNRKRTHRNIDNKVLEGYFPSAYIGVVTAEEVKALIGTLRVTVEQLMWELVAIAKRRAQTPLSGYQVGAVCRGNSGALYLGANLEFIGDTPHITLHAEQTAITFAMIHRETGIRAITVSSPPCGHCRQFINELPDAGEIIVTVDKKEPIRFKEFYPYSFGPDDLNTRGMFAQRQTRDLKVRNETNDGLLSEALAAAMNSYSPYSHCSAGAAIQARGGLIYKGSYIENAAYNPCILPTQSAIINLIMSGRQANQIERVIIVHEENKTIDLLPASLRFIQLLTKAPVQTIPAFYEA